MRAAKLVVGASLILACGCSFNQEYPKDWPALAGGGCAALSGTYADVGAAPDAQPRGLEPRLARRFFKQAEPERIALLERADRVVISYDAGVLSIDARQGATSLLTAHFSEKDKTLKCTPEGAFIAGYAGWARGSGNPLVGREYNDDTLMPGADGSLIIRYRGGGTGMIYGVYPASVSGESWFRWPRLADPRNSS